MMAANRGAPHTTRSINRVLNKTPRPDPQPFDPRPCLHPWGAGRFAANLPVGLLPRSQRCQYATAGPCYDGIGTPRLLAELVRPLHKPPHIE